jgi:FtsH-binding integral membrane protein
MALGPDGKYVVQPQARVEAAEIDVGLRQYMLGVYNYMMIGLALTGLVAYAVAAVPSLQALVFGTPIMWLVMFGTLGLVFFLSFRIHKMSPAAAQTTFWIYAALNGVWLSGIVNAYTHGSLARAFLVTAGTFAAMSLYGYTTKRDLTGFGSFLFMGLIGLVLAMVVNIFLQSPAIDFALSVIGVLIFTGLTAWDTQRIKEWYAADDGHEVIARKSIMGALQLYLDFINLFLFLLRFLGNRN